MIDREKFVSVAPALISIGAITVLVLAMAGASLAAQIATSVLILIAAVALLWFSREHWDEWDTADKALQICLAVLLFFAAVAIPVMVAISDTDSIFRWPLLFIGIALTIACGALFIRRVFRSTQSQQ